MAKTFKVCRIPPNVCGFLLFELKRISELRPPPFLKPFSEFDLLTYGAFTFVDVFYRGAEQSRIDAQLPAMMDLMI